jgi:BlaI family transcriptional regulator, penicillinase repressor
MKPTDAEMEILHILWREGAQSVRYVNDALNAARPNEVGYTTTLKTMQVMFEKGLLTRDESLRSHVYAPAMPQDEMQRRLVNQFVNVTFKGSAMQMVMQALGNHTATSDEIAEIKSLIEQKEREL